MGFRKHTARDTLGREGGVRSYWAGVASREHVLAAISSGFCQLNHGKEAPLKRMRPGDRLLYYSPREGIRGGEPVQAFTVIGEEISNISTHAKRQSNRLYSISYSRVVRSRGGKRSGAAPFGLSTATIS